MMFGASYKNKIRGKMALLATIKGGFGQQKEDTRQPSANRPPLLKKSKLFLPPLSVVVLATL